jgi:hypothetical protein
MKDMKSRYVWILGVLLLGVVLFMRPMASAAAETIGVAQAPAVTTDQSQPATAATAGQGTQPLTQACIDAHKLPAAEQGQAMSKMMNDPNLIGAMNQMMNGSAGSMMSGWQNSQNGGK